jgi:ABC-type uncharacterized transport system ATPase subunit
MTTRTELIARLRNADQHIGDPQMLNIAFRLMGEAADLLSEEPMQPLTDEQIEACYGVAHSTAQGQPLAYVFARTIEQAHGITGETK